MLDALEDSGSLYIDRVSQIRMDHWTQGRVALVGDAADGYPGIPGIGPVGAAQLLNHHGAIEAFPPTVLGERRDLALLFKRLATLRTDADLFANVAELHWGGPTSAFESWTKKADAPRLLERCLKASEAVR